MPTNKSSNIYWIIKVIICGCDLELIRANNGVD